MRDRLLRSGLVFLTLGACLLAQGPGEALRAEAWYGTFSYHTGGSGSEGDSSWSYQGAVRGSFSLDTFKEVPDRYVGTLDATLSYHSKVAKKVGDCVDEQEFNAEGAPINTHSTVADAELLLRENGWQLRVGRSTVHGTLVVRHICDGVDNRNQKIDTIANIPYDTPTLPYPASGALLSATFDVGDKLSGVTVPPSGQRTEWHGEVHAQPTGDLILEVDATAYPDWRPTAILNADGSLEPGEPIEFTATVKHKSGKPVDVEVDRMEWELVGTSREPGIAIDAPMKPDASVDMRFDPYPAQFPSDADKQHVTSAKVEHATDRVRVVPYDWGAWSVLKVTAYVRSGLTLQGRLKGTSQNDVRLPKRAANSLIADGWKRETGARGADASDDDAEPAGDGDGDGLTLYEEYRGFYERGVHRSGDPKKKDYFVWNRAGQTGRNGIRLFAEATGLAVHVLSAAELGGPARVVNRNHQQGPHVVDQHGVILQFDPGGMRGRSKAYGGPGTPGSIAYIGLAADLASCPADFRRHNVAHELSHSVNVWHHGEADRRARWLVSDGRLYEENTEGSPSRLAIRVQTELGVDVTAGWIALIGEGNDMPKYVGMPHAQHSGFENCLMRYAAARVYQADSDMSLRYEAPSEVIGEDLCATAAGTGVNDENHQPQSRYSSAAPGRGNCRVQIRVSDQGVAPTR
jgi:hypothetical protein